LTLEALFLIGTDCQQYPAVKVRKVVLKELDEKFRVIENRIRALLAENKNLTDRISTMEQELLAARREAQVSSYHHGTKLLIREKIENILHTLESIGIKKNEDSLEKNELRQGPPS